MKYLVAGQKMLTYGIGHLGTLTLGHCKSSQRRNLLEVSHLLNTRATMFGKSASKVNSLDCPFENKDQVTEPLYASLKPFQSSQYTKLGGKKN